MTKASATYRKLFLQEDACKKYTKSKISQSTQRGATNSVNLARSVSKSVAAGEIHQ